MATTNLTSLKANALTNVVTTIISTANIVSSVVPKVSSISYSEDYTAIDTAGGTVTLNGSGFNEGASVLIDGTYASVVTVVSSTTLTFTAPAKAAGTYVLYVINTDGGTAISIPGISYSGTPTWSTASGSIATLYETTAISNTVTSTGDAPITYSLYSGTLPPGSSLNTSTGLISGTSQATASSTTYNFTIRATDAQNQYTDREFSITINPDVVTWSSPANATVYSVFTNSAIANVEMSATSASGGSITYTADTLPTGLSITGANIAGTPTVAANTSTTLTATSTSTRSATRTINWVVSVANDTYFKNVTLLLNGETTVTPFNSDASTNNLALTIAGDTKPNKFNPYTPGYYSNSFDGNGDFLSVPSSSTFDFDVNDFTIEFWMFPTASQPSYAGFIVQATDSDPGWFVQADVGGTKIRLTTWQANILVSNSNIPLNQWTHIAIVRNGGGSNNCKMYFNGVLDVQGTFTNDLGRTDSVIVGGGYLSGGRPKFIGYLSNMRVVNGTAVYTSAFTPPTSPLTTIANTSLLTCQSNRLIDNSTNNFTITKNGDVTVSPAIPFTPNSSYSTYGSTYFDGTGDYLTVPDNTALESFTDFTIEFWVYFNSVAGSQVIVDKGWNGAIAFSPYLIFLSGGSLVAYASAGGGSWDVLSGSSFGTPSVNTWYHIALTRSGSSIRLFRDGVVITTVTNSSTLMNSTSALGIGGSPSAGANPFNGYISNLRIVKGTAVYTSNFTPSTTPLTAIANTSLLTLQYNGDATNKGIIDNSNFNNIITRAGNASQGSFSPYSVTGWSNYFDGTGDYLTVPSNAVFAFGTGAYTIEAWVYLTDYSGTSNYRTIVEVGTSAGPKITVMDDGSLRIWNAASQFVTTSVGIITLQTWHHVAWVRESTSLAKLYVNGTSVLIVTTGAVVTTDVTGTPGAKIGYFTGYGHEMKGYISNLRIVKGTAVYTSAFTPPNSPLTAIANTSLLTCQSNRFIDNSPNSFTLTRNGDTSVQAFGPFGSVPEAVPISYSNYFDGTGDYLTVPDNAALQMGSGDFTIEFWINYSSIAGYQTLYSKGYTAAGDILVQTGNGNGVLIVYLSGSAVITESTGAIIGTWYHYALVRSGTAVTLYRDGISRGTATSSVNFNTTNQLGIGAAGKAPGGGAIGDFAMNGYISNLRIIKGTALYTSAFTPPTTPLTAITNTSLLTCQSNRFIDNSINNFTLTRAGDTSVQAFGPFGSVPEAVPISYSNSFNGTSDYLNISSNAAFGLGTDAYTIEGWFYPTTTTTEINIAWRIGAINGSNSISGGVAGNSIQFRHTGTTTATSATISILNTWNHVAWVRNSGTVKVYLNGTEVISTSASTSVSTGDCTIGYESTTFRFNGSISNFRVVKGTAVYTSAFTPSTTPLTAIANTSLLTCQSTTIKDNSTNAFTITASGDTKPRPFNPFGYTAQSATSYTPTTHGGSIYFDGTGDYLTVPNSKVWDQTIPYTVEMWIYPTSANANQYLYSQLSNPYNGIVWTGSGFNVDKSYVGAFITGSGSYSIYQWIHVAMTYDGTTTRLFANGTLIGSAAGTGGASGAALYIANYQNAGTYTYYGYMSDLRVTPGKALYTSNFYPDSAPATTTTTIGASTYSSALLLNGTSGGIIDQHGTNVLETVGNAQLSTAVKKYNNASMYFDGTSSITIPASPQWIFGTGDFTIEFWMNTADTGAGLITPATTGSGYWALLIYSSTLYWQNAYNSSNLKTASLSGYLNNTWVHIAIVKYSGNLYFYFNGAAQGSATSDSTNYTGAVNKLTIGYDAAGNGYYTGYIDDLRITKGYARYTANFTPPTALTTR